MRHLLVACALAVATGCHASVEPAYVEARYVPAHVHSYPYVYYEGRPVYLIDGRWYFNHGSRWVYYREEPAVLYRERAYIQQAPPPRRRVYSPHDGPPRTIAPPVRQSAPPVRRSAPPARQSAPPARRAR